MPVPSDATRQLGESGTRPSQYGQVDCTRPEITIQLKWYCLPVALVERHRLQSYSNLGPRSTVSPSSSNCLLESNAVSRPATRSLLASIKTDDRIQVVGQGALGTEHGIDSSGTLPPPAVGSRTTYTSSTELLFSLSASANPCHRRLGEIPECARVTISVCPSKAFTLAIVQSRFALCAEWQPDPRESR